MAIIENVLLLAEEEKSTSSTGVTVIGTLVAAVILVSFVAVPGIIVWYKVSESLMLISRVNTNLFLNVLTGQAVRINYRQIQHFQYFHQDGEFKTGKD